MTGYKAPQNVKNLTEMVSQKHKKSKKKICQVEIYVCVTLVLSSTVSCIGICNFCYYQRDPLMRKERMIIYTYAALNT